MTAEHIRFKEKDWRTAVALEDLKKGPAKSAETRGRQASERAVKVRRQVDAIIGDGEALSLRQIAASLNDRGITAPRGGKWHAAQVKEVLCRSEGAATFS